MQELLAVIISWIAINFGLPVTDQHPRIEFASSADLVSIRSAIAIRAAGDAVPPRATPTPDVYAFYDDKTGTIYLSDDWSAASPADVSLLVHETVHHLQKLAGSKYACPAARERAAYDAQKQWLALFDMEIYDAFEINRTAILFLTRCVPP